MKKYNVEFLSEDNYSYDDIYNFICEINQNNKNISVSTESVNLFEIDPDKLYNIKKRDNFFKNNCFFKYHSCLQTLSCFDLNSFLIDCSISYDYIIDKRNDKFLILIDKFKEDTGYTILESKYRKYGNLKSGNKFEYNSNEYMVINDSIDNYAPKCVSLNTGIIAHFTPDCLIEINNA